MSIKARLGKIGCMSILYDRNEYCSALTTLQAECMYANCICHWTWMSIPSELETLQSPLLSQDDLKIETIDICYRQATNTTLRVVHFWLQLPQELTLSLSMSTKARLGKIGYMSIILWQQWILFCFDHFASRLYICKLHLLLDLLFWEYPTSPRLDTEGTFWDHDWPFDLHHLQLNSTRHLCYCDSATGTNKTFFFYDHLKTDEAPRE